MSECAVKRSRDSTSRGDHDTNSPEGGANSEVSSTQLFACAKALIIRHGSERYTLRLTSKGKLILTK